MGGIDRQQRRGESAGAGRPPGAGESEAEARGGGGGEDLQAQDPEIPIAGQPRSERQDRRITGGAKELRLELAAQVGQAETVAAGQPVRQLEIAFRVDGRDDVGIQAVPQGRRRPQSHGEQQDRR